MICTPWDFRVGEIFIATLFICRNWRAFRRKMLLTPFNRRRISKWAL